MGPINRRQADKCSVDRRTVGAMIVMAPVDSEGASRMGSLGSLLFRGTARTASPGLRRRRAPGDQAPRHAAYDLELPLSSS